MPFRTPNWNAGLIARPESRLRLPLGLPLGALTLMLTAGAGHAQSTGAAREGDHGALSAAIDGCVACHGVLGAGSNIGASRLAGQNTDYLAHALSMFKARTRASPAMQAVAQSLSDGEMHDLAAYFSTQHPPLVKSEPGPSTQLIAAGKELTEMGAGVNVAACFSCHAAGGQGDGARFPRIAGQPEKFIVDRLHEFQDRAKGAAPNPGTMTAVAATLTEQQITQAAAYLSAIAE